MTLENNFLKKDLYDLRNCDDFILHYVSADTHLYSFHNYLSNKSRYIGDGAHYRNNLILTNEHIKRQKISDNIYYKTSNKQNVTMSDIEDLLEFNNVVFLIDDHLLEFFLNSILVKNNKNLKKYKDLINLKYSIYQYTINNDEYYLKNTKNYNLSFLIYKKNNVNYPMIECLNNIDILNNSNFR